MKKILIGLVILGVLAVAFLGFGTYFITKDALKEREPQLRQYMQLNAAEQNEYILTHADEILAQEQAAAKPDEKKYFEFYDKVKDDPAVKQTAIELGRSLMATAIVHSDTLVNELSDAVKASYQQEANDIGNRMERYSDAMEAADAKLNAAK